MAKELPYFKFEPSEWDNGNVQMLSNSDKVLFIDICCMYWLRLGDLPEKLVIQKLCVGNANALQTQSERNAIREDEIREDKEKETNKEKDFPVWVIAAKSNEQLFEKFYREKKLDKKEFEIFVDEFFNDKSITQDWQNENDFKKHLMNSMKYYNSKTAPQKTTPPQFNRVK